MEQESKYSHSVPKRTARVITRQQPKESTRQKQTYVLYRKTSVKAFLIECSRDLHTAPITQHSTVFAHVQEHI